jgi:tight adherence protein C
MFLMSALILGTCASLALGLANLRRRSAHKRLMRLAGASETPGRRKRTETIAAQGPSWLLSNLARLVPRSMRDNDELQNRLRRRLVEAGYRQPSAVTTFLGSRVALALALPPLPLLLPAAWDLSRPHLLLLLIGLTTIGYILPSFWIDRRRKWRQTEIRNALPDALDLMVVCVQAGLGVVAALDRVVRDMSRSSPILASEFLLTIQEVRAGKTSSEGLRALADRTGVSEMSALVAMLIQTERFGTGIAETLRVHADSLRARRMQRAEELANKAPLKMLFPSTLIFFATLVVSVGPAMLQILGFFADN